MKTCKTHGEYQAKSICTNKDGVTFFSSCPFCQKENEEKQAEIKKSYIKRFIDDLDRGSNIPARFKNIKLSDYICNKKSEGVFKYVQNYSKNFKSLKRIGCSIIFCGKPGTGKTHLACAIANKLISEGEKVLYTTTYKILSEIKSTYNKDSALTESAIMQDLKKYELIIFDEIGVQFGSETEKILFYQIINSRYEDMFPTIIISNLDNNDLRDFLGERVLSRFKEGKGAVLACDWENYREGGVEPVNKNQRPSALEKYEMSLK